MSRNGKAIVETQDEVSLESAVQFVLTNVPRSQLLEMYYWTREQDILRIVRGLVMLPKQTRQELILFLDQLQHARNDAQHVQSEDEHTSKDAPKSQILPN